MAPTPGAVVPRQPGESPGDYLKRIGAGVPMPQPEVPFAR